MHQKVDYNWTGILVYISNYCNATLTNQGLTTRFAFFPDPVLPKFAQWKEKNHDPFPYY